MSRAKVVDFVFYMILLITVFIVVFFIVRLTILGKENNSYMRSMNCIASVSPTERTPEYVQECYSKAEQANKVKLERYGNGK